MNKRRRYKAKARRRRLRLCWLCRQGLPLSYDKQTHWCDGTGEVECQALLAQGSAPVL